MISGRRTRLVCALLVFVAGGFLLRGYLTDDTFIHLRYARNLLEHGEFSFNTGQSTYGATSPLWVLGLALLLKLGVPPLAAAWWLGGGCGALALVMIDAILSRLTYRERWKFVFLVAAACDPWFLRWSFSGMETPLATLFLLVLLWPLVSGRDLGWGLTREPLWRRYLGWGVAAGLAGMVRPEFLLTAPLALPILLWFEYFRASSASGSAGRYRTRPYAPLAAAALGWGVSVGPWLIYAWRSFGRLLPETASAKAGGLVLDPLSLIENLFAALRPLAATQGFYWLGSLVLVLLVLLRHQDLQREPFFPETVDGTGGPDRGSADTLGWSVWGPVALVGLAAVWTVVMLGGYAVRSVWVISRYVSPLAPVHMLAMSVVAEWLLRGSAIDRTTLRSGSIIIGVVVVAAFTMNLWIFTTGVLPHAHAFPRGIKECYVDLGTWLKDNTPDDAVVAALDIGAVGYASERHILDLMGLVSPEILALGSTMGFGEMIVSGAWLEAGPGGGPPDYLVDRTDGPPRWSGKRVLGVDFELLKTCILPGVGLREAQPWTVALYRLSPAESRVRSSADE